MGPHIGRQPPPLSSVLYGIISERRSVLAVQILLREKSGAKRVDTDNNIPSLPDGSIKIHMVEAENEFPYCLS
jgi:hypothetical protein